MRLTGENLHILSWAGLDLNRGVAQAIMSVTAGVSGEMVTTGIFDVGGAGGLYYSGIEGRVWENSPSITVELATLARPTSPVGCRGAIPETVTCEVYAEPGRATGTFGFFGREIGLGTSNSVFEFRPTVYDLPVTGLRIVDTVRFANGR